MSGEKNFWRLPTPFRGLSGKQDLRRKVKVGHSGNRVSSVYLSHGSSTSDFIVVPEFDDPLVRSQTIHEESDYTSHQFGVPAVSSSPLSTNGVDSYFCDSRPEGPQCSSYLARGSCDTSAVNTSRDDDLTQRLGSAYEHIRSMPSAASPKVLLSSDPQMLRKQLGVPQHSVLNYPIHSSPDLPNPHASPRDPMSPRLPPATESPEVSHARTSKLGLHINTAAHPPSRHYHFPDPFQSTTQRKSMVTAPTPTEIYPSRSSMLGAPWSAHIACTSDPQPYIPNPSKLSKRCIEKPIVSPSSLPSSRRQAWRGVLRKSAADTPLSSANAHRWKISLPQIRPPSPFRVDMPLHHTWHDRRTDFNPSPECHFKVDQCHEIKTRRTSGSTEVLASLAWIGAPPVTSNPYTADRKRQPAITAFLPDRFSMAIAVEDDSISDDVLVDRLEKVRRIGGERGRVISCSRSSDNAHFPSVGGDENGLRNAPVLSSSPPIPDQLAEPHDVPLPSPLTSKDAISDSEDTAVWQAARKALLCIREIVRTERKYQEALKMLLNAQTATPPPLSMIPYVSTLVRASEMLLKCFLEDPSAWGVSTAFVTSEDELEAAMVSWCTVAGAFFTDGNDPQSSGLTGRWRLHRSGVTSNFSSSVAKQTSISPSPQLPPMFSTTSPASKMKKNVNEEYHTGRHLQTVQERQSTSVSKPESLNSQAATDQPPSRKLSVRDLAIQPIQRVMRYVLLYRDLLDCTPPTSPPHLLVERALEAATRIANHCDRAQRNPAFYHAS